MNSRLSCNPAEPRPVTRRGVLPVGFCAAALAWASILGYAPQAAAGDAPQWMHALVNAPVPAHDEKTNAVLLYAEENVNVISADKIKITVRRAYKVLRPEGRDEYGTVFVSFRSL